MKLQSVPTIYPKGYKEWLAKIKYFCREHKWLPKQLKDFNDQDGWLEAYHLNYYDSQALDYVCGWIKKPKKRVQDRASQYEKELNRFMDVHSLGLWEWAEEDQWDANIYFYEGLSVLEAVDVILGLRPLTYEDESA